MANTEQDVLPLLQGDFYGYEGTREMNTLIVGRAITGMAEYV